MLLNFYVPWDISYLTKFLDFVKSAIGTSTGIGILIFAVVFGVTIICTIVYKFAR